MKGSENDARVIVDEAEAAVPQVLVIGYGNPLRGDDAVGWVAAQRLAERVDPEQVATLAVHQLTPELSDPISKARLVMFIDAAEGQPPGYLTSTVVKPAAPNQQAMTHHVSPEGLLTLARQVFGRCPQAQLFTVGGVDFGHKDTLSPAVERACDRLVARLGERIADALRGMTHA